MSYLTRLSGFILIVVGFWGASAFADNRLDDNQRIDELRSHMIELELEMESIAEERDPTQRRILLTDHMKRMHEALLMMQEIIVPAMNMWAYALNTMEESHQHDVNSEEHMESMVTVIEQMQILIDQTFEHQRALNAPSSKPMTAPK